MGCMIKNLKLWAIYIDNLSLSLKSYLLLTNKALKIFYLYFKAGLAKSLFMLGTLQWSVSNVWVSPRRSQTLFTVIKSIV